MLYFFTCNPSFLFFFSRSVIFFYPKMVMSLPALRGSTEGLSDTPGPRAPAGTQQKAQQETLAWRINEKAGHGGSTVSVCTSSARAHIPRGARHRPFPADVPHGHTGDVRAMQRMLSCRLGLCCVVAEHVLEAAAPVCHQDVVPVPVGG